MSYNEWTHFKVGELGKIITGKTPLTKDKDNFDGKYPFITPVDMVGQKNIVNTIRTLSEKGKLTLKNNLIPQNSICISCIGSDMGKVVKTTKDSFTNQQINSIICNDKFDPDFVYYALTFISPEIRNIGKQSTAVPIVNKTDFSLFQIFAPKDKVYQSKISNILSSLDDKIELNRQTNLTLENIVQTLFKEMCIPKNGLLTDEWKSGKLKDYVSLKNGFAFKGKDFIDDGIAVLKIKNIKTGKVNLNKLSYVSREIADKSQKHRVYKNDILISMSGNRIDGTPETWVGKVGIFHKDGEYLLNQRNAVVEVKSPEVVSKYFLLQYMCSEEIQYYFIANATSSGGQANISPDLINNTEILIPPFHILKKYEGLVGDIYENIFKNELEIETLSELRDRLLPKLMKGEIEINSL